jgi:hypothetical protein
MGWDGMGGAPENLTCSAITGEKKGAGKMSGLWKMGKRHIPMKWRSNASFYHSSIQESASEPTAIPVKLSPSKTNQTTLYDTFGRHHTYLRISITERCNLRCKFEIILFNQCIEIRSNRYILYARRWCLPDQTNQTADIRRNSKFISIICIARSDQDSLNWW